MKKLLTFVLLVLVLAAGGAGLYGYGLYRQVEEPYECDPAAAPRRGRCDS
jgi:hypothetical protein